MIFRTSISTIFTCDLSRAFKTPMLTDISKIHTGLWLFPKLIDSKEDENWGKVGGTKKLYFKNTIFQKNGIIAQDKVITRDENKLWVIEISEFQSGSFGFTKFVGIWKTQELSKNKISVTYTYELHASKPFLYPINWLFTHFFWKKYMQQIIRNINVLIAKNEPYIYP